MRMRTKMKARLQLIFAFALLGALVAAGALLPAQIAVRLDGLLLEKVEAQSLAPDESENEGDEGEGELSAAVSLAERLGLFALSSPETLVIPVETGRNLSSETVREVLDRELEDLRARGLYPLSAPVASVSNIRTYSTANFYVLPSQPNANGIIWVVRFEDKQFSAEFFLDDESEKVLGYGLSYEGASEDLFVEQTGVLWMEYLGLPTDGVQVRGQELAPPLESDDSAQSLVLVQKRFLFTQEINGTALEFTCGQSSDGTWNSFSLSVNSLSKAFIPPAW
jgi:hypothetical protein